MATDEMSSLRRPLDAFTPGIEGETVREDVEAQVERNRIVAVAILTATTVDGDFVVPDLTMQQAIYFAGAAIQALRSIASPLTHNAPASLPGAKANAVANPKPTPGDQ